jgi:hypothetical protein
VLPPSAPISAHANLGLGTASYTATNVALGDYTSIPNSLSNGSFTPATASWNVNWSGGPQTRGTLRDPDNRFVLDFIQTGASISWSAATPTTSLRSTGVTSVNFAEIGRERNGVFVAGRA